MSDETPRHITINLKKLRMRDLGAMKKRKEDDDEFGTMVPIMARVTGLTEDEVWDLDFETSMRIQEEIGQAMDEVVKKTSGGR